MTHSEKIRELENLDYQDEETKEDIEGLKN